MEMSALVHQLLLVRPLPEGWVYGLPTRAEFIRAARGDGVRRFPWGDRFSWESAVNYYSLRSFPGDAVPEPAGYRASDVSPFGVCDLAGSVAEITPELYGPLPGEYVLLGGSFRRGGACRGGQTPGRGPGGPQTALLVIRAGSGLQHMSNPGASPRLQAILLLAPSSRRLRGRW